MVCPRRLRLVRRDAIYCRDWVSFFGLPWPDPPLQLQVLLNDLRDIFFGHLHVPQCFIDVQPELTTRILPLQLRSLATWRNFSTIS